MFSWKKNSNNVSRNNVGLSMQRTFGQSIKGISILLMLSIVVLGCGSGGSTGPDDDSGNDNNDPEPEPVEYSLSVLRSPSDGGSVDPSSGTFEEDSEVTVEASANEGFIFREWSGDVSSEENPLTFDITADTDITANFDDLRSTYTVTMQAISAEDTVDLRFGQSSQASDDFDEGIDEEAPPAPPEGALHAYFEGDDMELFRDFRSNIDRQVEWMLQYQVDDNQDFSLEWEIEGDQIEGDLILTDESESFEVDMKSESAHTLSSSPSGTLYITYNFE